MGHRPSFFAAPGNRHRAAWALLAGLTAFCLLLSPSGAQSQSGATDAEAQLDGERLLRRHCARCHMVGTTGTSPHPAAPMFKNLSRKYPVELLEESLAEGLMSGHPDMPVFYFTVDEVDNIITYLKSIQSR